MQAGLRFALLPPAERGVELRYRRAAVAAVGAGAGAVVARLRVPLTAPTSWRRARSTWLAPRGRHAYRGQSLHARFTEGAAEVLAASS